MHTLRLHLRSNVVGYLALFVALGGTSYALKAAPGGARVIHGCFQRRSGVLRIAPVGTSCRRGEQALAWNREGQQGPAGPAGAPGSPGPVGPQGLPGLTVAAANGESPLAEPDGTAALRGPTTITTTVAGSIFATGRMELGMRCPATTTYNCSFTAGLYIDGKPVPASSFFATVQNGGEQTYQLNLFGVLADVPAGTHQVTIGWKSTLPNKAEGYFQSELSSSAILLGS